MTRNKSCYKYYLQLVCRDKFLKILKTSNLDHHSLLLKGKFILLYIRTCPWPVRNQTS
jgi:hypothetical protein